MKPLNSVLGLIVMLSLLADCAAYRSGDWPKLNYEDPGAPVIGAGAAEAKPVTPPPPPPGPPAATPALVELAADFDRLSQDATAQLQRLDQATEMLDGSEGDARRRNWLALQLELSRLNRLRGELTGLIQSADDLTAEQGEATGDLPELRHRMQQENQRLAAAARQAEGRLKESATPDAGQ